MIEGLVTWAGGFNRKQTVDRLKVEIAARGLELLAEIDHAKNAEEAEISLRPQTILVFGNAGAGTLLMQANQAAGLELPLKILVWEDADGKTWISYSDPVWIARRFGLPEPCLQAAKKMNDGLEAISIKASA